MIELCFLRTLRGNLLFLLGGCRDILSGAGWVYRLITVFVWPSVEAGPGLSFVPRERAVRL